MASKITKNKEKIREWAEERKGKPTRVKGTKDLLRIDFPDDENLEEITWEEFFEVFENKGLSLLYEEETANGDKSRFNKLVNVE